MATRANEPTPAPLADIDPPAGLKGSARKVWKALAPRLVATGVLTSADVYTFARYCRLYAAWEVAMKEVEESSDRSAILSLAKLDELVRRLESGFGLNPADRTGIKVVEPEQADGKERFFRKAG